MGSSISTRVAYGNALTEFGEKYRNIVVLDADVSKCTMTMNFKENFPERFFNMGISEGDMMTTAAGLATCGKIPFASTFAVFAAGRAFDQIRNSIVYPNLNVKIGATHAGISIGEDGGSHQSIEDIALMRVLPNMVVISPADAVETKAAVRAAIEHKGPVYIRLGRIDQPLLFDENSYRFNLGKGIVVKKGTDISLIVTGIMLAKAIEAANILEKKGIKARVINIHTIKPIDSEIIINAAKETGKIITVEEHSVIGGLGSAVAEVLIQNCPVKMKLIGVKDKFGVSGKPEELLKLYGLSVENIVDSVINF
jgi:transketolase